MAISSTTPRIQYLASAGQTVFTVPFKFFDDSDLKVYITPDGVSPDDATQIKTLTTDYTVSGAGAEEGGTITLTAGATLDDLVTIIRDVPDERTTDLVDGGDLYAETLNEQLEKFVAMVQEANSRIDRSVIFPNSISNEVDTSLPPLVAGGYLKVDSTGTGFAFAPAVTDLGDASGISYINEALETSTLETALRAAEADIAQLDTDVSGLTSKFVEPVKGELTLTGSNVANVAEISSATGIYLRIDNMVHVAGKVTVRATATGQTSWEISGLPGPPNFSGAVNKAYGVCQSNQAVDAGGIVYQSGTSTDKVVMSMQVGALTARVVYFNFLYEL